MSRQDTTPGGGATLEDAGLVPEPTENRNLLLEVEALRSRIFLNPDPVAHGQLVLGDGAKLVYIGGTDSSPKNWSARVDFENSDHFVSIDFGVVEQDRALNPFQRRDTLTKDGDTQSLEGTTATPQVTQDFDRLLVPLPPYKKTEPRIGIIADLSGPNTGVGMPLRDFLIATFGKKVVKEGEAKEAEEERTRKEAEAPLVSEVDRLRERIGILNPSAYIKQAELFLTSGHDLDFSGGFKKHPEFWVMSIGRFRRGQEYGYLIIGYQSDNRDRLKPTLISDYLTSGNVFDTKRGLDAVPQIEQMIDELGINNPVLTA